MKGNQPVLFVRAKNLPEAFNKVLEAVWEKGCEVPTSFDRPGDLPSKDATVLVEIENPLAEPRFHKLAWPGGPADLEIYRLEVIAGVHDHWIKRGGVEWNYTYHERLRAYDTGKRCWKYLFWHFIKCKVLGIRCKVQGAGKKIDQIENMIQQMVEAPDLFRRRFQVVTWIPSVDPFIADPPCLQRLHFRWLPGDDGYWVLNLNSDWRSRDLKALYMNVFAMTELQRLVAIEVGARRGIKTRVGRYSDKSDSLHIYGKDFSGPGGVQGLLEKIKKQPLKVLCWDSKFLKPMFEETRHLLAAQLESEKRGAGKGVVLPKIDWQNFPYPKEWDL